MIELLLEKYLNTYRWSESGWGTMLTDVFTNPSRKDMKDARQDETYGEEDAVRFIVDSTNKTVYVWGASKGLHQTIWKQIRKDIGDSRVLYETETLMVGVYHINGRTEFDTLLYYKKPVLKKASDMDWTWAERYIPNFDKSLKKRIK